MVCCCELRAVVWRCRVGGVLLFVDYCLLLIVVVLFIGLWLICVFVVVRYCLLCVALRVWRLLWFVVVVCGGCSSFCSSLVCVV